MDFDDAMLLAGNFGQQFATSLGDRGDGNMTLDYNAATGAVTVEGASGSEFSSITIKVLDDTAGNSAGFEFNTGVATWAGQDVFQTQDLPAAQGFVSIIGLFGTFTMTDGDVIGAILPPGLSEQDLLDHLGIQFNQSGVPGTNDGDLLVTIPEPGSVVLAALGLLGLVGYAYRRRHRI